jgi:hypothetical protein
MGIFHLLCCVHGNIPRSFQWLHEQFPWKYFYAMNTNTATLGSQVQIPNRTKTICKVRRFNALYKYVPFKRLKLKPIYSHPRVFKIKTQEISSFQYGFRDRIQMVISWKRDYTLWR